MSSSKAEIRETTWRAMEVRGVARLPSAKGQIPNFVGAERAALHLLVLPEWRRARAIQVSPAAPQLPVRRLALRDGKTVYVAMPWLPGSDWLLELDPARLGPAAHRAASLRAGQRLGRRVSPAAVPRLDLVVCGSVAVNVRGARVGQGGGCWDLEYAVLAGLGKMDGEVPVITTVHGIQLVPGELPMEAHDVPVDLVMTPDGPVRPAGVYPRPGGVRAGSLRSEVLDLFPGLAALLAPPA